MIIKSYDEMLNKLKENIDYELNVDDYRIPEDDDMWEKNLKWQREAVDELTLPKNTPLQINELDLCFMYISKEVNNTVINENADYFIINERRIAGIKVKDCTNYSIFKDIDGDFWRVDK